MSDIQAAIYARVSSEQQAEAHTIESQLAALRERIVADGLSLPGELQFSDEGYSGTTLVRPALERLRDVAAAGGIDRLYVHSPDRLARKYAYQVLLVDEFHRNGIEIVFLNREIGRTPEDDLLLQVQGMVAEYERAKILERSRRGKRHAAHSGSVSVLSAAPYGYRYVSTHEGGGQARFEIYLEEARVVRQVFEWVGRERATIGEVCRRLNQAGERTRTGKITWDRSVVWGMLKNPAYIGMAAFGKTHVGPMRPRLRTQRGRSLQPRRAYSTYDVPSEEWISVPVPKIVDAELFDAVQEQLRENQQHARQRQSGARYLLQGLVTCKRCGYAYYGKPVSTKAAKGKQRDYAYYRCIGTDAYRFGGQRVCENKQVRTDLLDMAVWYEVRGLLENPQRLEEEYRRRLEKPEKTRGENELARLQAQIGKLRQGIARLIDSYAEGLIEKSEFEPRITQMKQRIVKLEEQARQLSDEATLQAELKLIIGRLGDFAAKVNDGLDQANWPTQRDLIRSLVKRVEVDQEEVNVVFRVGSGPFSLSPDKKNLQDCGRRVFTHPGECVLTLCTRFVVR
ncbi:MAG: recombinase family protein, partial [Bacteroidota bacterium]